MPPRERTSERERGRGGEVAFLALLSSPAAAAAAAIKRLRPSSLSWRLQGGEATNICSVPSSRTFPRVSSCATFRHSLVTSHPASDSAFVTRPLPPLLLRLPHSSVPSFFLHPTSMLHPLQHSENLTQRQIQFARARPRAGGIKSGMEEDERREGIAAVMRLAKGGRGSQLQRKRVFSRDVAYAAPASILNNAGFTQ